MTFPFQNGLELWLQFLEDKLHGHAFHSLEKRLDEMAVSSLHKM